VQRQPDILLIVADCLRQQTLDSLRSASRLEGFDDLMDEGSHFKNAISPSSWSLPAHASLFTGLYPWEHGVVSDFTSLSNQVDTISSRAQSAGYRTASFSANPYVGQLSGLSRGFDTTRTGGFEDCYFRRPRALSQPLSLGQEALPERSYFGRLLRASNPSVIASSRRFSKKHPGVIDFASRAWNTIRSGDSTARYVSPWIEQQVNTWVRSSPRDIPILTFINLLDAHEPYLGPDGELGPISQLLEQWRANQWLLRHGNLVYGEPTDRTRSILVKLYELAVRTVGTRVSELVDAYVQARPRDSTIVILVGDHGQVFGEAGQNLHGRGFADDLFRVPLFVSGPGIPHGDPPITDVVSTKDVANYLFDVLRAPRQLDSHFSKLKSATYSGGVAWALSGRPRVSGEPLNGNLQQSTMDDSVLVCYRRSDRIVFSRDGDSHEWLGLSCDHSTAPSMWRRIDTPHTKECEQAQEIGTAMDSIPVVPLDKALKRLIAWGYA